MSACSVVVSLEISANVPYTRLGILSVLLLCSLFLFGFKCYLSVQVQECSRSRLRYTILS
jgi:hypothetical protein